MNILYLICQDAKVSVDPQLWKMLARKIGTLGKVIDGENNASMNAKEAPANGIPNNPKRQSVQDELQSFFADTSPNDTSTGTPKIPIKGTIMSFFKKQSESSKKNEQQPKKKNTTPPRVTTPSPFVQSIKKNMKMTPTSPQMPMAISPKQPTVEWACEKCTFINSQPKDSRWLKCTMCGERYFEKPSPTVTPTSTQSSQEDPIILMDESEDEEKAQGTPNGLWNTKKRQRTKPSKNGRDVVVLDADIDQRAHKEPTNKKVTKRLKAETEDVICLDESDGTTKSQVPLKSSEPMSPRSVLSFSVSKNSGRITIHYAGTNESSLVNFSPEQVLTEETANRLLDTKIHRRSSSGLGISLQFNKESIHQSKLLAFFLWT